MWKAGKTHSIPDALSRAPVDDPTTPEEEEAKYEDLRLLQHTVSQHCELFADSTDAVAPNATLDRVRAAACADPDYLALIDVIRTGFPDQRTALPTSLRAYWNTRHALTVDGNLVLCGSRLAIPHALRHETLGQLHASHQGMERTKSRAQQNVFWPNINQDINLADRFSGWPVVVSSGRGATAKTFVSNLTQIFALVGVPQVLKSDDGPQFTARHTKEFLCRWGVTQNITSPHYHLAGPVAQSVERWTPCGESTRPGYKSPRVRGATGARYL